MWRGNEQATIKGTVLSNGGSTITKWQYREAPYESHLEDETWTDIASSNTNTASLTITGLTNFTAQWFQMRALNAHGASEASSAFSVTPSTKNPARPTDFLLTLADTRISCDAVSSVHDFPGEDGYVLLGNSITRLGLPIWNHERKLWLLGGISGSDREHAGEQKHHRPHQWNDLLHSGSRRESRWPKPAIRREGNGSE